MGRALARAFSCAIGCGTAHEGLFRKHSGTARAPRVTISNPIFPRRSVRPGAEGTACVKRPRLTLASGELVAFPRDGPRSGGGDRIGKLEAKYSHVREVYSRSKLLHSLDSERVHGIRSPQHPRAVCQDWRHLTCLADASYVCPFFRRNEVSAPDLLRARAKITSHFAAVSQACGSC